MKVKDWFAKLTNAAVDKVVAALPRARAPLSEEQRDELEYRNRVNAEAAARRAERAWALDALLRRRGRWLRPHAGWLKRRPRQRW